MVMNQLNNIKNDENKMRNRLVGLATLLLFFAVAMPLMLTDKSSLRTSTTPILQSNIVNQQNQTLETSDNVNDSFVNNSNNHPDIPYMPDDIDKNSDSFIPPDILTPMTKSAEIEQESKPYMIQLVALKNKQKIEELVALLRLNNYNVRIIPKNPDPDQLIKLQVGPYAKKEQVEQVIISLNNLTKLKGIIVTN